MEALPNADRLIIAYDPDPDDFQNAEEVEIDALRTADRIAGCGAIVKNNSALRLLGYRLIPQYQKRDLKYFADVKLVDISNTMINDAKFLEWYKPDLLTVMCSSGIDGMKKTAEVLSYTKTLGVTVLTSFDEETCRDVYGRASADAVKALASLAIESRVEGLVLSPLELEMVLKLKKDYALGLPGELVTPGIRPEFTLVEGDDQSRFTTPRKAIASGATRIVVGRPITQAKDPLDAIKRIVDEINQGLEDISQLGSIHVENVPGN